MKEKYAISNNGKMIWNIAFYFKKIIVRSYSVATVLAVHGFEFHQQKRSKKGLF